jgi:hypothetical protein
LDSVFGVGSNPVAPTFFSNKPFGENVEGLCYLAAAICG